MIWSIRNQILGALGITFLIITVIGGISYWSTLTLIDNNRALVQAQSVLTELNGTLSTITDAETAQRGYLITGDEEFLEPYTRALPQINEHMLRLATLTRPFPDQRQRLPELQRHLARKLDLTRTIINTRRTEGFVPAQAIVASGEGKAEMDAIRRIITTMVQDQHVIIQQRATVSEASISWVTWILGGVTLLNVALLPLLYMLYRRDIRERQHVNAALAQARDQALEASRLKSDFLATMSHEIRTPMNAIIGMTELLLDTPLDDDQREFTTLVHDAGQALLTIINDILDFSKIEAGKLVLDRVDFEVGTVVEGVAEILSAKASEKRLALMTYVSLTIPPVQGDPGRVRQILLNLVGNALKFTSTGEVVVRAQLETPTDSTVRVRFTVTDTGIGLSESAQQRLFHAFTQADSSTTRKYGGTGLGLAIAKRLVELMGGAIGVDSTEGHGATFWFTAQFEPASALIPARTADVEPDLQGQRVLVIDDSLTSRDILQHYLHAWGIRAEGVDNGEAGLSALRTAAAAGDPFALAIIDLAMPGMDGFAVARVIRRDGVLAATSTILLTAFDERGQGEQAIQAGFAAYLTKPVRQAQLRTTMTKTLADRSNALRQGVLSPAALPPSELPATWINSSTAQHRILLAEDNPANQKLAVAQLTKMGYVVDVVDTGRAAVTAIHHDAARYGLILMDVQMPDMDGLTATHTIRATEQTTGTHIPIIAMTANAMPSDRDTCLAAGMDDYISKPVNRDKLREALERWLPQPT